MKSMEDLWKLVTGAVLTLLGSILLVDLKQTRGHDAQIATLTAVAASQASDLAALKTDATKNVDRLARIETNLGLLMKHFHIEEETHG